MTVMRRNSERTTRSSVYEDSSTEAMSTAGSDRLSSTEGDAGDVFYSQPTTPTTPNTPTSSFNFSTPHYPIVSDYQGSIQRTSSQSSGSSNSSKTFSRSFDSSLAQILEIHRALAQAYTGHQTNGEESLDAPLHERLDPGNNGILPIQRARAKSENLGNIHSCKGRQFVQSNGPLACPHTSTHKAITSQNRTNPKASSRKPHNHSEKYSDPQKCYSTCMDDNEKQFRHHLNTISENLSNLLNSKVTNPSTSISKCSSTEQNHHEPLNYLLQRPRSQSVGACSAHALALLDPNDFENDLDDDPDEDQGVCLSDGGKDDYGFLSHYSGLFLPSFCESYDSSTQASSTMYKSSKSPVVSPRRLLPKRWRKNRRTESPAKWTPAGSYTWTTASGRSLRLTKYPLVTLSTVERLALQKICLNKLGQLELGTPIALPKESSIQRSKRSAFSLKRKTSQDTGWVFGIPLSKVNSNDIELRRRKPASLRERRDSLEFPQTPRHTRKSSSSSVSLRRTTPPYGQHSLISLSISGSLELLKSFSYPNGAISSDSLSETDSRSTAGTPARTASATPSASQPDLPSSGQSSNLLDALSLSSSAKLETSWRDQRGSLKPHTPQVPYVVRCCCKHLENYGLQVLGIFRIGSSKKRIKQLRDEFDSGHDVKLNEDHNPHDVGGLLKVFFRDMPDPLLTRYLYSAFLATRKFNDLSTRVSALRMLVALLPAANRDTLWALLTFLSLVSKHSKDSIDEQGNQVAGNKMDAHNLATLFAPNIMHKAKGGEFEVTSLERAEDRHDVIAVVKDLIENYIDLFEVPVGLYDHVIRLLLDTNPETADYILHQRSSNVGLDTDTEASSSCYTEESDSSLPRTPSYSSENGSGTLLARSIDKDNSNPNGVKIVLDPRTAKSCGSPHTEKHVSSETTPRLDMLQIPQFRISSPDQGWYRPDSRSPSPMSPRISPSPKAMKSATPDLRIRVVSDTPRERAGSTNSLIYPRPVPFRRSSTGIPSSSSSSSSSSSHMLTVPPGFGAGLKRDRDSDSSSSLSSYYLSSSRSATNSPISPHAPASHWSNMDTPPASPSSLIPPSPSPHRSLASETRQGSFIKGQRQTAHMSQLGLQPRQTHSWQQERWPHWEKIAQDQEVDQETLV